MPYATSVLALTVLSQPAQAGCTVSNATLVSCSTSPIYAWANPGASSLIISGATSPGVIYNPPSNAGAGSFTETLTITGNTTFDTTAGQTDPNDGATVNMLASSGNGSLTLNSTVTTTSGVTINSHAQYGGAIMLRSEGAGNLSVTNAGTVTSLGVDNTNTAYSAFSVNAGTNGVDGITATSHLGSVTIINSGSVTAYSGRGLYGDGNYSAVTFDNGTDYNIVSTSGAAATVTVQNTAAGTVNAYLAALRAINYYGLSSVSNAGTTHSSERQALVAWSAAGDASATNSGTATADDRNAIVAGTEHGNATITNSGTVTASKLASGSLGASAGYSGLRGYADTSGNVIITNSGSVTANSDAAIVGHTPSGNTTITNTANGTITGLSGVFVSSGAGQGSIDTLNDTNASSTNTSSGTASLTNNGTIGATHYGAYLDATTNSLTNGGTLSASSGTAVVFGTGGTGTISNSGIIKGATAAFSGPLNTLANSGVVAGDITNSGTAALTLTGGNSAYGLLTGYNGGSPSLSNPGSAGSFSNTGSDIALTSGFLWLNDNLTLGGHTFSVAGGAGLKVSNAITLSGNYSQTGGSLTVVSGGVLTLSGNYTATVSNTAITLYGASLTAGSTYTLVNANATGTYTNNTINIKGSYGLGGVLSTADNGNDLVVTLASSSYTSLTTGGASTGMGSTLDQVVASSSAEAQAFKNAVLAPLSDLSPSQQRSAVKQLAPTQIAPAVQAATQAATPTTSVIEQHELALMNDNGIGVAAGNEGHKFGLWGQVVAGTALRSTTANASGYRANNRGFVTGADFMQADGGVLGLATSWIQGWSWGTGDTAGTSTTINSYQLTGYGLHRLKAAFVDWQVGFGYNTYDQNRSIAFLNQRAKAKYDGQQYLARLGTGYDFPLEEGGLTLTPMAGLHFLRAVSSAYQESGSDANLTVDRRGVQTLSHELGGKVTWKTETGWGRLTPEARIAWVHDYNHGPTATSGLMGGSSFVSTVARPSADGAKLNLAITFDAEDSFDFRAEYEGEARPDYQSHTGLFKARLTF